MEYSTKDKLQCLDERVTKLEYDRHELSKLSALMELQYEMNKEQDDFLRQQSNTLIKMNENLTALNNTTGKLDHRIETLEDKFVENTIEAIKLDAESKQKQSINVPDLMKNILVTVITTICVSVAVYLITLVK